MQRVDPYRTAAELRITEWEREGLIATMRDLRAGTASAAFQHGVLGYLHLRADQRLSRSVLRAGLFLASAL